MVDIGFIIELVNSPADAALLAYILFEIRFGRMKEVTDKQEKFCEKITEVREEVQKLHPDDANL